LTFDSWKLFVIVFGICKCTYFDLHEYEGLKDQLFKFVFVLNCKKKNKKITVDQVQRKQIYIKKKKDKIKRGVQHNFYCNLIVVY